MYGLIDGDLLVSHRPSTVTTEDLHLQAPSTSIGGATPGVACMLCDNDENQSSLRQQHRGPRSLGTQRRRRQKPSGTHVDGVVDESFQHCEHANRVCIMIWRHKELSIVSRSGVRRRSASATVFLPSPVHFWRDAVRILFEGVDLCLLPTYGRGRVCVREKRVRWCRHLLGVAAACWSLW